MTKVVLLKQLKEFTEQRTKDLLLPVASQKDDKEPPEDRAADVYRARLPDSRAAKKKAPYILHQVITGKDAQPAGQLARTPNLRGTRQSPLPQFGRSSACTTRTNRRAVLFC